MLQDLHNAVVGLGTIVLRPDTNENEFEDAISERLRATGTFLGNGAASGVSELSHLTGHNGTHFYTWTIWWSGNPLDPADPGPDIDEVAARYCAACEIVGQKLEAFGSFHPLGIFAQLPLATERV